MEPWSEALRFSRCWRAHSETKKTERAKAIYLFLSPLFRAFGEKGKHDGFKIRSYWLLVQVQ